MASVSTALAVEQVDADWNRSNFTDKTLVYAGENGNWLKSTSAIWHPTIDFGGHVPIANLYPELKDFFVDVLRVSTVTDVFMMEQLAKAASKAQKDANEIKKLMCSASELLDANSQDSHFEKSLGLLQRSSYLPCKLPTGGKEYRSEKDTFFIVDNEYYANKFDGRLILLDFTYGELTILHDLFRILRLDDRYLSRYVRYETSARTSAVDEMLTEQFRQCAYPISW